MSNVSLDTTNGSLGVPSSRLTDKERQNVEQYAAGDTTQLKRRKKATRYYDFFSGLSLAFAFFGFHWIVTDHAYSWQNVSIAVGLLALAALLFFRRNYLEDHLHDAMLLSPPEAYLRLDLLEKEIAALEAENNARDDEFEEARRDWYARSEQLKAQITKIEVPFAVWCTILEDTQHKVVNFSRWVNAELAKPPAQRELDTTAFLAKVEDEFLALVQGVVDYFKAHHEDLFGHSPDVYFYDVFELREGQCHLIARAKTEGAEEHRRPWPITHGHIGEAIYLQKATLRNDNPTSRNLSKEPNSRATDLDYFKCIINAPIPAVGRKPHNYYGVLVATSSVLDSMTLTHMTLVDILAHSLAAAFFARERDCHKGNQPLPQPAPRRSTIYRIVNFLSRY